MKRIYLLLLLGLIAGKCCAQRDPSDFFQKLFIVLKNKNADSFVEHFASIGQFKMLMSAYVHAQPVAQDSLNNAPVIADTNYTSHIKTIFSNLIKQVDSLHIDLANSEYIDCDYREIKDRKILCTSLTGDCYFKNGGNYYRWHINEAVLIAGKWRIVGASKISVLNSVDFLSNTYDKVSAFDTFSKDKIKVSVVLAPPPPDVHVPPPPPPPQKPKKKKQ